MTRPGEIPCDTGWSWMIVLGSFLMNMFVYGSYKSFGVLFVEMLDVFNATSGTAALVPAVVGLCSTITPPMAGVLSNRFGNRTVVMVGGVMCSIGCIGMALSTNMIQVIILYGAFTGVGYGLVYTPGMAIIGHYFKNRYAVANGLAVAGASTGQFIIPPLMRMLIDAYTLRGAMLVMAAVVLHITVGGCLMRPPSFYRGRTRTPPSDDTGIALTTENKTPSPVTGNAPRLTESGHGDPMSSNPLLGQNVKETAVDGLRVETMAEYYTSNGSLALNNRDACLEANPVPPASASKSGGGCCCCCCSGGGGGGSTTGYCNFSIFRIAPYLVILVSIFFGNIGYINAIVLLPPHADDAGISKTNSAFLVSIVGFGDLVGRVSCGLVADLRCVRRRMRRYHFVVLGFAVNSLAHFVCPFWPVYGVMVLHSVVLGVFGGSYIAMMAPMTAECVGVGLLANALGFVLMVIGIGNTVGAPIMGMIRDLCGSYQGVFWMSGVSMVLGAVTLMCMPLAERLQKRRDAHREAQR